MSEARGESGCTTKLLRLVKRRSGEEAKSAGEERISAYTNNRSIRKNLVESMAASTYRLIFADVRVTVYRERSRETLKLNNWFS